MILQEIKEHFVGLCLFGLLILIIICGAFIWELNKKIENKEPIEIEIKLNDKEENYEGEEV